MESQVTYGYNDAWKAIIRPQRDIYKEEDLGLKSFLLDSREFKRTDLNIKNERGLILRCSFFEPVDSQRAAKELPCVIYLHGNSSSRIEAIPYVSLLLPSDITLFCFDFAGSGLSEGEYVSLGWWEREDLKVVIEYLRGTGRVSSIALWGRSMGAVTALLHADRDPSIAGLVLDSPFASMNRLTEELLNKYASNVPGFVLSVLLWFVKKSIKSRANFSMDDLVPIDHVGSAFIPAQFIVANADDFICPSHGVLLYEQYAGDKHLVKVEGDHNSKRPNHALSTIYIFLFNTLMVSTLLPGHKLQIPNVSKLAYPKHVIPPPVSMIVLDPKEANLEEVEDEDLKKAIKDSLVTYELENEQSKFG
eukprot:TRINITY_DN8804_c0_g4_i1.p1 TRINITY_DN8804_c0_g4~~TRINITY_DN8804_c0_g4_i1.p1  ORF type:complete len:362 (+),score=71.02 TRINITY_DN8804_c0_g4_i1:130-1215(+)